MFLKKIMIRVPRGHPLPDGYGFGEYPKLPRVDGGDIGNRGQVRGILYPSPNRPVAIPTYESASS